MAAQSDLLMPKKHKSAMTWWSRHEPIMLPQGNSDHWSKMKSKCTTFTLTQNPLGGVEVRQPMAQGSGVDMSSDAPQARFKYNKDGTVSRVHGDHDFHEQVAGSLRQNMTGSYSLARARTTLTPNVMSTSYNARAREGYKYWFQERPKPTMFGRYGIGSYKTVLGLGNAPRT